MASVNPELRKKPNADGTHVLRIRVTHDRKTKYFKIGKIRPKHWNQEKRKVRKSHSESDRLNSKIKTLRLELENRIYDLEVKKKEFKLSDITDYKGDHSLFKTYILEHIAYLKQQDKFKAARKYKNVADKVALFDPNIKVSEINEKWITLFCNFLRKKTKVNSEQTVSRYIKFIKTILNSAYKDNQEVNKRALTYKVSIPKFYKPKLSMEDIYKIESFNNEKLQLTCDTFLLQFYMRGLRIGDVLQLNQNHIKGNNIILLEQKTKKVKSIRILPKIQNIIDRYKGHSDSGYFLPWLTLDPKLKSAMKYQKHIESKTSMINKQLKLVAAHLNFNINLSTHVARHSFATLCLTKGISLQNISKMLNHSDFKTTQTYLNSLVNQDELDKVAERVFG